MYYVTDPISEKKTIEIYIPNNYTSGGEFYSTVEWSGYAFNVKEIEALLSFFDAIYTIKDSIAHNRHFNIPPKLTLTFDKDLTVTFVYDFNKSQPLRIRYGEVYDEVTFFDKSVIKIYNSLKQYYSLMK